MREVHDEFAAENEKEPELDRWTGSGRGILRADLGRDRRQRPGWIKDDWRCRSHRGGRTGWCSATWLSAGSRTHACSTAFRTVPRHKFLPPKTRRQAYDDESIPIGEGQTITPPYDVAFMTEVLDPQPTDKVYEVGTGSGYQSSILSRLVKEVYSVEIHALALGKRPPPCTRSWATRTSTPGSATATRVGPRRPRSTRSSSPAPRSESPGR